MPKKPKSTRGGAREGAGRPPSDDPRTGKVMCRFTAGEMLAIETAAEIEGMTVATFCAQAAVAESARVITRSPKST
jgi:uncharacterized protein (DUF1778 family)